jgi:hypothetical protein
MECVTPAISPIVCDETVAEWSLSDDA